MKAKHVKQQFNTTTSISAGQALEKLENLSAPEAKAIQRLLTEYERAVVKASLAYDGAFEASRLAVETARLSANGLYGYIRACLEIARVDGIGSVAAYATLDRQNAFKFSEHVEAVFLGRGGLGKKLSERLKELRQAAATAQEDRSAKLQARAEAEQSLASAMLRLRGAIDTARAVLNMNGISIVVRAGGRKPKASAPTSAPQPVLTAVPTPPDRGAGVDDAAPITG